MFFKDRNFTLARLVTRYRGSRARMQCAIGWVAAMSLLLAVLPAFAQTAAKAAPAAAPARTVLVMGDSLSAGYGLSASQGWVSLTADRIAKTKPGWRVVNASISGETTAGGASRIDGVVARASRPGVVDRVDRVVDGVGGVDRLDALRGDDAAQCAGGDARFELLDLQHQGLHRSGPSSG